MLSHYLVLAIVLAQPGETPLEGYWRNPSGSVIVAIAPCGKVTCGRVQWASDKAKDDARKGGTDPLVGVELFSGLVPKGQDRWRGRLFVPDINKTSKADLRQLSPNQIKVTGCAIRRLLCKSQVWTRTDSSSGLP